MHYFQRIRFLTGFPRSLVLPVPWEELFHERCPRVWNFPKAGLLGGRYALILRPAGEPMLRLLQKTAYTHGCLRHPEGLRGAGRQRTRGAAPPHGRCAVCTEAVARSRIKVTLCSVSDSRQPREGQVALDDRHGWGWGSARLHGRGGL